jgi:hypothetical protein
LHIWQEIIWHSWQNDCSKISGQKNLIHATYALRKVTFMHWILYVYWHRPAQWWLLCWFYGWRRFTIQLFGIYIYIAMKIFVPIHWQGLKNLGPPH